MNGHLQPNAISIIKIFLLCETPSDRWEIARNYTNKLISAFEVVDNLYIIVDILPATESQARSLAQLEPEQQQKVLAEVTRLTRGKTQKKYS